MSLILSKSGPVVSASPENVIPEPNVDFQYSSPNVIRKLEFSDDFTYKSISGTIYTDNKDDESSLAFITAYRQGPDDGYEYSSFYNGYGVAIRCGGALEIAPDNIFVVFNSLGTRQVVVEKVIHTGWGDYGYLASTKHPISNYTLYNYELIFTAGGGLDFYIWENTKPLTPTISYGAFNHGATGSYYGVSTSNSCGKNWMFSEIFLSNIIPSYATQLSRLDVSDLGETFYVSAHAFGVGYNGGLADNAGIVMYCYNHAQNRWDEMARHYNSVGNGDIRLNSPGLLRSEYSSSNLPRTVDILLSSIYPNSYDNGVDSYLYVDYVKAEAWSTEYAHIGGKGDIYIKDTASLTSDYMDIMNCDTREVLILSNDKITNDFSLPILWIDNVELLDFAGNPTGSFLVKNNDWTYECLTPSYRFSPKEEVVLILASPGWNLRVHYQTFTNIGAIQTHCDSIIHRNVTDDLLVKTYHPIELFINLTVIGTESPFNIRNYISEWIKSYTSKTLKYSDIAIMLQNYTGINDVTVNNIDYRIHLTDGSYSDQTLAPSEELELSNIEMFVIIPDVTHISITVG